MTLSKSLYTCGIQYPKALWLKKHKTSVLTPPDESALTRFEIRNIVGDLACELFPNGAEVPFIFKYGIMINTTKQWLEDGVKDINEATFNYSGLLVMVDTLHIEDEGIGENEGIF